MTRASARLAWAVGCLDVHPGERLLELGSGHGVAVELAVARGATVVAVDRSPTMAAAARRRNADAVAAGAASILTASLHEADLGDARFDKAFGVHFPPLLRGNGGRELDVVRRHLAPAGRLYVLSQPLGEPRAAADGIAARLRERGWAVDEVRVEDAGVCVVARPA